jgi:hypothetical protein
VDIRSISILGAAGSFLDTRLTVKRLTLFLAILFFAGMAHAQCTGSGTAWSCPAGTTDAQRATVIASASNNAVVTFAGGTYNWSSNTNFSTTKGVTLICATGATCTVNSTGTVLGLQGFSGTLPNLYRISGFTFVTSNSGQAIIWFDACNPGCRGQISQLRIDHNTVIGSGSAGTFAFFGDTQSNGYFYGVIDHNTITTSVPMAVAFWIGAFDGTPPAAPQGQSNNLFVEDNTLNVTTNNNASVPCLTDAWGFAAMVVRHNTVTNCSVPVHDLGHAGGPANWEVYNNQFILNSGASGIGISDGYRMVHHQGAQEEMFWNNSFTTLTEPHNGDTISALAGYVDADCSGIPYPCLGSNPTFGPQPGRDSAGVLKPIYGWGNFDATDGSLVTLGNESAGTFVATNRDIYPPVSVNANSSPSSPFDGTVGTGFGTLANRPSTCTHSNATNPTRTPQDDGHGGVGYAVETVVGTIGASAGAGTASDSVLYSCTALNTWSVAYTPYTYPHPLVAASTPPPPAPATQMFAGTHIGSGTNKGSGQ